MSASEKVIIGNQIVTRKKLPSNVASLPSVSFWCSMSSSSVSVSSKSSRLGPEKRRRRKATLRWPEFCPNCLHLEKPRFGFLHQKQGNPKIAPLCDLWHGKNFGHSSLLELRPLQQFGFLLSLAFLSVSRAS